MRSFPAVAHLDTDKYARPACIVISIIEFRHVTRTQLFAKRLEAPGLLRDRHGENGFAVFAQFRFLCDKAQAVKVHIGPTGHRDKSRPALPFALRPGFCAGNRQGPGRLKNRPRILENILDGRAHGVGIDTDDFVHQLTAQLEGLLADLFDRHAISKQTNLLQFDPVPCFQRLVHGIGIDRLNANNPDFGTQPFDIGGYTGNQSATTDGDKNRIYRAGMLTQDFHGDGPLAGDDIGIVIRVHVGQAPAPFQFSCMRGGFVIGITMQHHPGPTSPYRIDLDFRRGDRHDDGCLAAQLLRSQGHALCMVTRRRGNDTPSQHFGPEVGHLVVSATQLE